MNIEKKILRALLGFAEKRGGVRYILASVLFESDGKRLELTATDGRKLASVSLPMPTGNAFKFVASRELLELALKLTGKSLLFTEFGGAGKIRITDAANEVCAECMDASKYPAWRAVLPEKETGEAEGIALKFGLLTGIERVLRAVFDDDTASLHFAGKSQCLQVRRKKEDKAALFVVMPTREI